MQKGFATEDELSQALAYQMGVPFVRVKYSTVLSDAVHRIPGKVAETHNCIPISLEGSNLNLAMANPMDLIAVEDVEHITGLHVVPHLATYNDINDTARLHYANIASKQ